MAIDAAASVRFAAAMMWVQRVVLQLLHDKGLLDKAEVIDALRAAVSAVPLERADPLVMQVVKGLIANLERGDDPPVPTA